MGHYMTKEGVSIICKNCLYWGRVKYSNGVMGTCGNANQKQRNVFFFNSCVHFWPDHEYRK